MSWGVERGYSIACINGVAILVNSCIQKSGLGAEAVRIKDSRCASSMIGVLDT